ncbi:MAG: fatty acid--CoA ligase family protein [Roseiflexaceae bacterium]
MFVDQRPERSLAGLLVAQAARQPDALALQQGDERLTYHELRQLVQQAAGAFAAAGVQPGAPVALLFQNAVDCVVACLGLAWLEAQVVPLEADLGAERLAAMQQEIGFGWLAGRAAALEPLAGAAPQACRLTVDRAALAGGGPGPAPAPHRPNAVFVYHYTSGSTGLPKAALHSQENLINGGLIYEQTFRISSADRILVPVPVLHSFGMVGGMVTALVTGAALLLVERFVPRRLVQTLAEARVTVLLAVPLMYEMLTFGQPPTKLDFSALRLCLATGAALPEPLTERFQRYFGQAIHHVYGCSEAGIIAAQTPDDPPASRFSVGRLVVGAELRVLDDAGHPQPAGEPGWLAVRTPAMFHGYFNNPEATGAVLSDGWYRSQDIGVLRDGYLYLSGRGDTFINVGSKKVNPVEVEQVLCAHPQVREAVVWAGTTTSASESVRATVALSGTVAVAELIAFCRERLPAYKVPVAIEVVASLPRNAMGKIVRPSPATSTA